MKNKLLQLPITSPWHTMLLVFLLVAACGMGLPKLIIDGNLEAMLDQDSELLLELYAVEADFSDSHPLLIGVAAEQGDVLSRDNIALLQRITQDAWHLPLAYRVDSVTNYQHTEVDGDDLYVADLFPTDITLDDDQFSRAQQVAITQQEVVGQLVSEDRRMAMVIVNFRFPDKDEYDSEVTKLMGEVDRLVEGYQRDFPELTFAVSGRVAIDYGIQRILKQDGSLLIPMMLLLMIVILYFFLRSALATFASVIVIVCTGAATMGVLGWVGIALDSITCLSPIVIMTLAVADVVHVNSSLMSGMYRGLNKRESLIESVRYNALPVFLTSVTTILGVITFVFTELPSVKNLGIIIAIGVAFALLLTLTLLPALLSILPVTVRRNGRKIMSFARWIEWIIANRKTLLPICVVVCAVLAALAPRNQLNESPELFFKPRTAEKQAIDLVNQHMAGTSTIEFAIYTNAEGAVASPEFLATIEAFSEWIKTQYGVGYVQTVGDTFKRLNQNMHGDDPQWYRQPQDRELASQYLLLYEMSLPYGLDLSNQINLDKSGVRINVTTKYLHAANKIALKKKAVAWFAEQAPSYRVVPTGHATIMEQMVIEHLMPDMLRGGIIAIGMVSLVLFVVLRNWKLGLMGMLANLLPVMMGYGVWSQVNGLANIAVMSVAGICLGVVVDFAVHFLTRYRSARMSGNSAENAVRFAFDKVGLPLWTTTVVLVCGFWLLMLSAITLNSSLGALTGIIILITLLFDFLVLPLLLITFDR